MQMLRDRVSQLYYTHGLLCASHPVSILVLVCSLIVLLCYPLLYVPLPGNIPAEYESPVKDYKVPKDSRQRPERHEEQMDVTSIPRWYKGKAVGYVQQIVVKTTVLPWEPTQHDPLDALYAPLQQVFGILDEIEKFRHQHGSEEKSLLDYCLRISESLKSQTEHLLPEYGCLVLSPANLWRKDIKRFLDDKEILTTIYKRYNQALDAPPGIRDVLFGYPWRNTGISRYFIRNRQRTISFAITIVFKEYDEKFVNSLHHTLEKLYTHTDRHVSNQTEVDYMVHLHYKDVNLYLEYTHLIILYLVLLLYLYFSVKKIEMVKSKWGLALSAVVTVVSSLLISVSVCSIFGMNTRLNGGEIFPYLVMLIGVENVLVVTKSVVSTPFELDVKYRVATGLSKEGWYFTKNLLAELVIVLVGFFTFVPAIQEFCLFALVGLLTDFSLQMVFFVTVLSLDIRRMEMVFLVTVLRLDIRRMELSDLQNRKRDSTSTQADTTNIESLIKCPFKSKLPGEKQRMFPRINLTSGMNLVSADDQSSSPRVLHGDRFFDKQPFLDLPRRLRLIYFWASTRVVQRFIMVCSVIWIVLLVYKTGLVHHLTNTSYNQTVGHHTADDLEQIIKQQELTHTGEAGKIEAISPVSMFWQKEDEMPGSVKHGDMETWRKLSHAHWTTLFGYYNITISGKYISILPSIHLSIIIPPEEAVSHRVPDSKTRWPQHHRLKPEIPSPVIPPPSHTKDSSPKLVTNPTNVLIQQQRNRNTESNDDFSSQISSESNFLSEEYILRYYPELTAEKVIAFYPKSRMEFIITVSLGFLSVICWTYFMMVLYRCMCSRKYSKWRASWNKVPKYGKGNNYYKQIKEAVPLVLHGHLQDIECLVTDGSVIVSSCLGGQLRVWDSFTGECLHNMLRKSASPPMKRKPCEGRNVEDSEEDLYTEYHGNHGNISHDTSTSFIDTSIDSCDASSPRQRDIGRKDSTSHSETAVDRFESIPSLQSTIDTNFTARSRVETIPDPQNKLHPSESQQIDTVKAEPSTGFDFQLRFEGVYKEHEKYLEDKQRQEKRDSEAFQTRATRSKSWSEGDHSSRDDPNTDGAPPSVWCLACKGNLIIAGCGNDDPNTDGAPPSVWCLACKGNLIIAGCGNGKLEFWDSTTGALKCLYGDNKSGVTAVNLVGKRVIVARLDGSIDFLELETFQGPRITTPLSPSSLHRKMKGHSRHLSHSRTGSDDARLWDEIIHCTEVQHTQAHQRPITVLQSEGGRIVSGSQDFTLKVFRLEDYRCLYTLHGHTGSITALCMDKISPYAAVSGSADGTVRVWDLLTGSCVHKVRGHEGTVVSLTSTDAYIISSGLDDRLCVWERKRGHLLYSVDMETSCGSTMAMLNSNFLVTGGEGSLYLWDIHKGELVRIIELHHRDKIAFIHHIRSLENSTIGSLYLWDIHKGELGSLYLWDIHKGELVRIIELHHRDKIAFIHHIQSLENSTIVCDYGNDIKVIHFPVVLEKRE